MSNTKKEKPELWMTFQELPPIQTVEALIDFWKRLAERARNNAVICAKSESYTSAAENVWLATGLESCADDLRKLLASGALPVEVTLTSEQRKKLVEKAGGRDLDTYVKEQLGLITQSQI